MQSNIKILLMKQINKMNKNKYINRREPSSWRNREYKNSSHVVHAVCFNVSFVTLVFQFELVRPITSRVANFPTSSSCNFVTTSSSSNEKVALKVTALQREIAPSSLFPLQGRKGERGRKKNKDRERKKRKTRILLPLCFLCHTCQRLSAVVDNPSLGPSRHDSGPFLSEHVARKSDNSICGRRDFRPPWTLPPLPYPTSLWVMYEDVCVVNNAPARLVLYRTC